MDKSIHESETDRYPSVFERFKAALIDGALIVAFILLIAGVLQLFAPVAGHIRMILFLLVVPLYEPLQLWWFGKTVGHRVTGLCVVRTGDLSRTPNIAQAVIRALVRVTLGIFSLATVPFSYRQRSIHDMFSGTLTLYQGLAYHPSLEIDKRRRANRPVYDEE